MHRGLVLTLLTLSYIVGEFSHFILGIITRDVARDVGYGDKACFTRVAPSIEEATDDNCWKFQDEKRFERK